MTLTDPEYKNQFKIQKQSDDFVKYLTETNDSPKKSKTESIDLSHVAKYHLANEPVTPKKSQKFNYLFLRETSKSYDNHINDDCPMNLQTSNVNSISSLLVNDVDQSSVIRQTPVKTECKAGERLNNVSISLTSLSTMSSSSTSSSTSEAQATSDTMNLNNDNQTHVSNGTSTTPQQLHGLFNTDIDENIKKQIDEKLKGCESDSDLNLYTPKAVDLPSVQRLAKRLYYLDGFKANDVVKHLCKR